MLQLNIAIVTSEIISDVRLLRQSGSSFDWEIKMVLKKNPEEATAEFIQDFVDSYWEKKKSVCYLSTLGLNLKRSLPESQSVLSDGLSEFLRQNPVVQVVEYPSIPQKVGAVPLSVNLPEDITKLFSTKREPSNTGALPSYNQEFWNAFIRPIENGPRYICIAENGQITVLDGAKNNESDECYKLTEQDLTNRNGNVSMDDRVRATHDAINAWLGKNKLSAQTFAPAATRRSGRHDHLSNFISAFEGLPMEDLARIEVPLDILVRLNSRK